MARHVAMRTAAASGELIDDQLPDDVVDGLCITTAGPSDRPAFASASGVAP